MLIISIKKATRQVKLEQWQLAPAGTHPTEFRYRASYEVHDFPDVPQIATANSRSEIRIVILLKVSVARATVYLDK